MIRVHSCSFAVKVFIRVHSRLRSSFACIRGSIRVYSRLLLRFGFGMLLFLYNLLLPLFLVVSFPVYLRRMIRRGGYARNFFQRFGFFSHRLRSDFSQGNWSWVRAVSVGEVLVAIRLIEEIRRQDPGFQAVISTTTSTGYQLALVGLRIGAGSSTARLIFIRCYAQFGA